MLSLSQSFNTYSFGLVLVTNFISYQNNSQYELHNVIYDSIIQLLSHCLSISTDFKNYFLFNLQSDQQFFGDIIQKKFLRMNEKDVISIINMYHLLFLLGWDNQWFVSGKFFGSSHLIICFEVNKKNKKVKSEIFEASIFNMNINCPDGKEGSIYFTFSS